MEYRVISTDDHVIEPPDVWQRRAPARLRDAAPRIVEENGRQIWVVEGQKWGAGVGGLGAVVGRRFEEFSPDPFPHGFADMRRGCYDARARLHDMDVDGVDAEVLYPTVPGLGGQGFLRVKDPDLRRFCIRAYNDWLAEEFCATDPRRLVPLAVVPYWDVDETIAELVHCVKLGHKGLIFTGVPDAFGFPAIHDPYWDPLWNTVQELDVPIALHIGSGMRETVLAPLQVGSGAGGMAFVVSALASNIVIMANLIFSGLLERFPRLEVVSVESGIGWVSYFMELADDTYDRQRFWTGTPLRMRPSEYFRRQVYVNFWNEKAGLANRYVIGVDNILWESDYPHSICNWPNSQKYIAEQFEGVPEGERRKILSGNAMRLYKLG